MAAGMTIASVAWRLETQDLDPKVPGLTEIDFFSLQRCRTKQQRTVLVLEDSGKRGSDLLSVTEQSNTAQ